ncbi:hypothetical protein CAPTEDRAFT_200933 [Capitella teleta]|uniref:Uncharacterized protein n=1 Tax=Capitella teleta TaxID=283909 RepID=R7V5Z5_CAPTE|nr:hypothetical protein CAPTEDRAFT_200933 [Capitella teleta]|eukprot:ELU14283.1 hypothetical protein CAPTEDRAFT_200933 [Capitella teleta]
MHTVKLFDIFRDDAQEVIAPVYSKKCKTRKSPCLAEKRWARKHGNLRVWRSRFATDQEPVKSRRESERRPTQEMTGELKRAGRLAIRHSNSHRSNRNKNMERGGVLHLSTLKIMTLTGLDLCPESSRWTCRCPQHIQPRKEKDLEEDASFHRPAPVMSEDED